MIYCSDKDGDLDLYVMDLASGKGKRITNTLGYDGGAWFSPDGKKIVWRASRPKTEAEIKEYKDLLAEGMVAPTHMEVYVANADGSDAKQITFWSKPIGRQILRQIVNILSSVVIMNIKGASLLICT